jgi:stage IV sporulation protein FB
LKKEKCRVQLTAGAAVFYPLLFILDGDGWLAALLPGVVFHELGHLLALRLSGGQVYLLRLEAAGLYLDAKPFTSQRQALICTAAGPAAGLLWATVPLMKVSPWGVKSAAAAIVINGFNLLPALPLDGGEILLILTGSRTAAVVCSWAVVGALTVAFAVYRAWGLLVPVLLIARTVVSS